MNAVKTLLGAYANFFHAFICSFRLKAYRLPIPQKTDEVWLIEAMNNFPTVFNTYYYLKAVLNLGKKPKIIYFNPIISFKSPKPRLRSKIMNVLTQNNFLLLPWKMMFQSIWPGEWRSITEMRTTPEQKKIAQSVLKSLRDKRALESLQYDGLWVGDLIYDTYLRFKPAATVDLTDPFLLELIEYTVTAIPFLRQVMNQHHVNHVVTVYTSYLQHGLPNRVALQKKLETHAIGTSHQLISSPTLEFPYHLRNYHHYRDWFKNYPDQNQALARGKEVIDSRLGGNTDRTSFYVTQSAFARNLTPEATQQIERLKADPRKKIVFMCHDFIDSPHGVGSLLYPDFYEWLTDAFTITKASPYQFVCKPHPNGREENTQIISDLEKKFPEVCFLPKSTSNHALRELDIEYIITVYGTVTYEFAAMGYAVLNCGENAHGAYNFSIRVKDIPMFKDILSGKIRPKTTVDMKEIYEFLFTQYYRYDRGEIHPFPWDFDHKEMLRLIANDEGRTELMSRAILEIDKI